MFLRVILLILIPFVAFSAPKKELMKEQQQVIKIADEYEKAYFERDPDGALLRGKTGAIVDRFTDRSFQAHAAWQRKEDEFLKALNKIDVNALKGTHQYITHQLLTQSLENEQAVRICRQHLWDVNPMFGWHIVMSLVAEKQPVGNAQLREAAIKRWNTFDNVVEQEIQRLKLGLQEGFTAPKPVVQRVLNQLKIIISLPIEESPFFDFAKRDPSPAFKKQVAYIVENKVNPGLVRYAKFLEQDYLPQARDKIGLSALPNGEQCYHAKLKQQTTMEITPDEIHQYGLRHMQQLTREVAEIGQKAFGTQDMTSIFKQVKQSHQFHFRSEKEILDYNYAALERAKNKMPAWFNVSPKSEGIIKPYPLHRAKTGTAGEYHPPSEDGKESGVFYINTYQPEKRSRADQEATLFHELIPGHHFQVALSYEDKQHHTLDKFLWNPGYGEGWALYVERLADEMGLYHDDISRLGMLSNEAMRTVRLVVDPGIHVMNWTREEAIDYMRQHTALDDNLIEAEVDRYCILPGQATSYMLGKREIESLRAEAKARLGERFDIREYHWQVLKSGSITLPMLRSQINDWIALSEEGKAQKT